MVHVISNTLSGKYDSRQCGLYTMESCLPAEQFFCGKIGCQLGGLGESSMKFTKTISLVHGSIRCINLIGMKTVKSLRVQK